MKKYKIGMYGGKFMPFHKGHEYCIRTAANECENVYVILFANSADEEKIIKKMPEIWLSVEERKRKMLLLCEKYQNIANIIPSVIDCSKLKYPNGEEDWDAETPIVRGILGNQLDAVYSSEESYGEYFSRAYPEAVHRLVDVKRIHYPISGTAIRNMETEKERLGWMV